MRNQVDLKRPAAIGPAKKAIETAYQKVIAQRMQVAGRKT